MGESFGFSDFQNFGTTSDWVSWLNGVLAPPKPASGAPRVLDLFAGCGGLGLGFEAAGFLTHGYEMKEAAARTYAVNLPGGCTNTKLEIGQPEGSADMIIGGPPCQPFSQIGYQRGQRDPRDGFPVFLDAVSRIRPKIAIIENVRGLLYRNKDYLVAVCLELERFGYRVDVRLLNARDYGTPQNRERVIIVATTGIWEWPEPQVREPVTAGIALGSLAFEATEDSKFLTPVMDSYIAEYEAKSHCVNPRDLHLDKPARTLTCRNFGAATSDMQRILLADGRRRMLTLQEGARLQAFPDWYQFQGTWMEQTEQIGNAVSPLMALAIARQAWHCLESKQSGHKPVSKPSLHTETLEERNVRQTLAAISATMSLRNIPVTQRKWVALTLLALAGIKPEDTWASLSEVSVLKPLSSHQITQFCFEKYQANRVEAGQAIRRSLTRLVSASIVEAVLSETTDTPGLFDLGGGTEYLYRITPMGVSMLHGFNGSIPASG